MAEHDADQGFEVRDRRRRVDDDVSSPGDRPPEADRGASPGPSGAPPPAQRNLVGLFMMLAGLAIAALDGVPDPATGQLVRDPGQAGELIDTLMLLRERTEGHRTPEESQALDGLIYDLQVRYVTATTSS